MTATILAFPCKRIAGHKEQRSLIDTAVDLLSSPLDLVDVDVWLARLDTWEGCGFKSSK
jgi:hypothetical protein